MKTLQKASLVQYERIKHDVNRQSDITQCERMTQCEKTAKADKRLATPTLEGARCDACHKRQFWDEDENEGKRTERRRGTLGNSLKDRQK